jgi:hypothetical protein
MRHLLRSGTRISWFGRRRCYAFSDRSGRADRWCGLCRSRTDVVSGGGPSIASGVADLHRGAARDVLALDLGRQRGQAGHGHGRSPSGHSSLLGPPRRCGHLMRTWHSSAAKGRRHWPVDRLGEACRRRLNAGVAVPRMGEDGTGWRVVTLLGRQAAEPAPGLSTTMGPGIPQYTCSRPHGVEVRTERHNLGQGREPGMSWRRSCLDRCADLPAHGALVCRMRTALPVAARAAQQGTAYLRSVLWSPGWTVRAVD